LSWQLWLHGSIPAEIIIFYFSLFSNVNKNEEMLKKTNAVNNVDMSSLSALWQNGPYKNLHTERHKNTYNIMTLNRSSHYSCSKCAFDKRRVLFSFQSREVAIWTLTSTRKVKTSFWGHRHPYMCIAFSLTHY